MSCELQDRISELESENIELKKGFRYLWMTMGFYKTPYNYSRESAVTYPDGSQLIGVLRDGGDQASNAAEVIRKLGFSGDQIRGWNGPFVSNIGEPNKTAYEMASGEPVKE